jgi:hypothetical protein
MIGNSLLTQFGIAGVAIGIVLTYIQPTFSEIKNTQDKIVQTRDELKKVTEVNTRLAELLASVNAIPQKDKLALNTYLPDVLDEVKVLKDLSVVTERAGVLVIDLKYEGVSSEILSPQQETLPSEVYMYQEGLSDVSKTGPVVHLFNLNIKTTYENFKELLSLLEKNNYPLEIHQLNLKPGDSGELSADIKIATYSLKE